MDEPARDVSGQRGVTRREAEVLEALAERLTNAEIAARLRVSERTVESHVSSLLRKLGALNRIQLVRRNGTGAPGPVSPGRLPYQLRAVAERAECVGRDQDLQRLLACWDWSAAGTTVAVIRGEAGIGKSRLAAAVAVEVVERGGRVAVGSCPDGPQRPYEPFLSTIADDVAGVSDVSLHRQFGSWATSLARISPDLADRLGADGPDVVDPEHERAAVHDALREYFSQAARKQRLLFVLEDLHWASSATRDAVTHLARAGGDAPLMLLATTRDEPAAVANGLGMFLGHLAALPSVEVVALSGLDVSAAASVIEAVGGDLDPELAVWQTAGNPLYLRELARDGQGSRSLRELVSSRYERLASGDLEVLDVATVAGEQIDVALVASAVDRPIEQVLDAVERAEAIGLIGAGAQPGRFAFTHDVFRSVRYASLTSSRRMRLHAAVAEALGGLSTGDRDIGERARHACLAGQRFDPASAADLAQRAGDAAFAATDYGEAAEHYRRAIMALDLVTDADEAARVEASIRLGGALILMGDPDGRTILESTARAAHRRGDPVALARAVCAIPLPGGTTTQVVPDLGFRSLAEAALDSLPAKEAAWRTRVQALLGIQLALTDAPDRGSEMVREALGAARRLDDPVAIGRALMSYRLCGRPVDLEERLACGAELAELGDRIGVEVFSYVGRNQLWWCYRELGDREQMDRWYAEAAGRMYVPDLEALSQPPAVALMDGDLTRAEQLTRGLRQLWDESGIGHMYTRPLRAAIEDCRGHLPDPKKLERALAAGTGHHEVTEALLARSWARSGHTDKARRLLDRARHRGFSPGYSATGGATSACCWAEVAFSVDDTSSARALIDLFEPLAGRFVDTGVTVWDTVDRIRALLRITTGHAAVAAEIATSAITASRRRRTPILLARELIVLACAQQRMGIDDTDDLVEEALAVARRTGARLIIHDARLYLTRRTASHPSDHFGLTRREREVIDLVASGATNIQVAAALEISPATVRKHLEHAYEKLGVSTRTAAAARTAPGPPHPTAGRRPAHKG